MIMTLPMALPEIGPVYAGSAGGILNTLQMAGAFFVPSYIIIPLSAGNNNTLFLFVSIGFLLYGIFTVFVPEMGIKSRKTEA